MKKLIMLGTATSVYDIPYDDPDVEIWGLGTCFSYPDIKRIDVGFEIHQEKDVRKQIKKGTDFKKFGDIPIFVQNPNNKYIKNIMNNPVKFPLYDLLKYIRHRGLDVNFECSWCYLIVYAIMRGYKDIEIRKVSLGSDQEYVYEKPSIIYWCATLGRMEGVKIHIPDDSFINYEPLLYGYGNRGNQYRAMARNKYLWKMYNEYSKLLDTKMLEYGKIVGAEELMSLAMNPQGKEHLVNIGRQIGGKAKQLSIEIQELRETLQKHQGCLQAEIFYNELLR